MKHFLAIIIFFVAATGFTAEDTKASLETLKKELNLFGVPKIEGSDTVGGKAVPVLMFGTHKINNYFDVVDNVKKVHGGTATVFVKDGAEFTRVTTNVLKPDGSRALGTPLAHNRAYDFIKRGETFCGPIEILKKFYDTCYEPIKDVSGSVIGIYYVGYQK